MLMRRCSAPRTSWQKGEEFAAWEAVFCCADLQRRQRQWQWLALGAIDERERERQQLSACGGDGERIGDVGGELR